MANKLSTQPYKGTRDFLPEEMSVRGKIYEKLFAAVESFGFQRYDGPVLESARIYEEKSGEEIANQQLYRLTDKGGRELALRPEMTPSVARMIAANAREIAFPARWYSLVNCHRYERPQRGRLREHWQLNVDIFGSDSVEAEIEIFDLVGSMMQHLGAGPEVYELRVNDRILVEGALTNYVGVSEEHLIDASMVLDRWHKVSDEARHQRLAELGLDTAQIERLDRLPTMDLDAYCEAAGDEATKASRLAQILEGGLSSAPIRFDPLIIRAFNYYTSTVFEVFDVSPDNPRSVFGGGRYDDLTAMFSKQRIPGIGFGMGDVTTWNFLAAHDLLPKSDISPDVFLFTTSEDYRRSLRELARDIRSAGLRVSTHYESVGMGNGMKRANRFGAGFTVSFAEQEMAAGQVVVKNMATGEQQLLALAEVAGWLGSRRR